jgi:hypothetical protein
MIKWKERKRNKGGIQKMKKVNGVSEDGRRTVTFITDDGQESTFFLELNEEVMKDCKERVANGEKNVFARRIPGEALQ